jgi:hypothetical protein
MMFFAAAIAVPSDTSLRYLSYPYRFLIVPSAENSPFSRTASFPIGIAFSSDLVSKKCH